MKRIILGLLIANSWNVAAARIETGVGTKFYLAEDGKQVSAIEADRLATLDKKLFQCQPVEKVCSERTGKCNIKAIK